MSVLNTSLPALLMPMHCTGFVAQTEFARRMPEAFVVSAVGTRIIVTNPSPIRWGGSENKTDAQLVAENVALQLERRVSFRRAMKKSIQTATKFGAKGIRVSCSGRLGGAEQTFNNGRGGIRGREHAAIAFGL